jgi:hypothetical protein
MYGAEGHHVKQNKPESERQVSLIFSHLWDLDLNLKDRKVEGILFGKREGTIGRGNKKGNGGEYDQSTLKTCLKFMMSLIKMHKKRVKNEKTYIFMQCVYRYRN